MLGTCPQFLSGGPDKIQELCAEENPLPMGLPNLPLFSMVDVDGDGDADGLRFSDQITSGGTHSVPPAQDLEYCGSHTFWNQCGQIDPVPMNLLRGRLFEHAGATAMADMLRKQLGPDRSRQLGETYGLAIPSDTSVVGRARQIYGVTP